ncbi:MAG: hypothetical protein K8J31_20355, partial [Anaerolineae bacterium]|nr:hypothetical protein [Anaerolineae bacterium]
SRFRALLAHTDMDALRSEFGQRSRHDDPLARLYAVFRSHYAGQTMRPLPETKAMYLASGVHHLLHRRFKRVLGLADEDVEIINPSVGGGTLLFFVIQQVFDTIWQQQQLGAWNSYVSDDLLPRLSGYEPSLAQYALAHLKISMKLTTTGYRFASSQRLNLYLSAASGLWGGRDDAFATLVRDEIQSGSTRRPHLPVTVVLNAPVEGDVRAQMEAVSPAIVTHSGGIAALVLPGGWLDDPEFRTLRARMLRDYSDIYLLKLADESLCVFVRRPNGQGDTGARAHFAAWEGAPEAAVNWLADHTLTSIDWQVIQPRSPDYLFVPLATSGDQLALYQQGWRLTEVMPLSAPGLSDAPVGTADGEAIPLLVRPFDLRAAASRPATDVLRHMLRGDNLALCIQGSYVLCSQHLIHESLLGGPTRLHPLYVYPGTAKLVSDSPFAPGEGGRRPNLNVQLILRLAEALGLTFVPDGRGDLKETFGPEDVFYYLYAVLSSPAYRERYAALLDQDEPRVPFPASARQFRGLSHTGRDLARLHLLRRADNWPLLSGYSGPGPDQVEAGYPRFIELAGEPGGRIYIHKEKYFSGVERTLWTMRLSGVQVLQTWLADRVGQSLSWHDLHHYQNVIVALARSADVLHEIDELLD